MEEGSKEAAMADCAYGVRVCVPVQLTNDISDVRGPSGLVASCWCFFGFFICKCHRFQCIGTLACFSSVNLLCYIS